MRYEHITDVIGNTPLVLVPASVHGLKNVHVYAKLEMLNPFGSVKDRIAWHMLRDRLAPFAEKQTMVVENSSGNTAKAMSALCAMAGVEFKMMSAIAKVPESKKLLKLLGADVEELTQANTDCFNPSDPDDPQYQIQRFVAAQDGRAYFPSQFTNPENVAAHVQSTGPEIVRDLPEVTAFAGGLGTAGSSRGVLNFLRAEKGALLGIGVCAGTDDFIPGIRSHHQLLEAGLYEEKWYDALYHVNAKEALSAMLLLNRKAGILCGPSSGAQLAGIQQHFQQHPATEEQHVVFLACDRVEWYLSYIEARLPHLFDEKAHVGLHAFAWDEVEAAAYEMDTAAFLEAAHAGATVIDTRTASAFSLFHPEGALNLPEMVFEALLEASETPFPKEKDVLLVCAVGQKSLKYAAYLRHKGYQAWSLRHGVGSYLQHLRHTA